MRRSELIALLCVAAMLVACGGGKERSGQAAAGDKDTLVIAFDGAPTNLDPRVGTDTYSGRIWDMTASGLIKLTPTGDFTGDLAEKWETPDDRTIVFHLRPGAKFQDGRPVTAKDIKFTFDSMMPETFNSPKRSGYAAVASFEAPDDQTFIIKLKEPNAGIFDNFPFLAVPQGADPNVFAKMPILAGEHIDMAPPEPLAIHDLIDAGDSTALRTTIAELRDKAFFIRPIEQLLHSVQGKPSDNPDRDKPPPARDDSRPANWSAARLAIASHVEHLLDADGSLAVGSG